MPSNCRRLVVQYASNLNYFLAVVLAKSRLLFPTFKPSTNKEKFQKRHNVSLITELKNSMFKDQKNFGEHNSIKTFEIVEYEPSTENKKMLIYMSQSPNKIQILV